MKLKIKVKKLRPITYIPTLIDKGEWIDLAAADYTKFVCPQSGTLKTITNELGEKESRRNVTFDGGLVPLGIAMKLPKGFEAIIAPRSSTFKNYGITQTNSIGVIDNSYSGDSDEWKFPCIALRDTEIGMGDRICQFRIQLSQKASVWQKLKWFLCSGIKLVEVKSLGGRARGGFGSTGVR